jgi:hypothetical protein
MVLWGDSLGSKAEGLLSTTLAVPSPRRRKAGYLIRPCGLGGLAATDQEGNVPRPASFLRGRNINSRH